MLKIVIRLVVRLFLFWCVCPVPLHAMVISNTPLESAIYSPSTDVMLVLDNSGSMDWEFMTSESEGLFQGRLYLFANDAYLPNHDHQYDHDHSLTASERRMWRSQWCGYNRIYFNPDYHYKPWPDTDQYTFNPASLHRPWSNPVHNNAGDAAIDLTAPFFSIHVAGVEITVLNAHYFTYGDTNSNGTRDADEHIYLITWVDEDHDGQLDVSNRPDRDDRRYYRFMDDGDDSVEDRELVLVVDDAEKDVIRPTKLNDQGDFIRYQTDREVLQNFANWCSFYRRRSLALKGAVAHMITDLEDLNLGICAVNGAPRLGVQSVNDDTLSSLLNAIYGMAGGGLSPLRQALDRVGRYFRSEPVAGFDRPYTESPGGHCQRHLALVVSDGFWNGSFSGVGNTDGNRGAPYADDFNNTLADVAAHYLDAQTSNDALNAATPIGCQNTADHHLNTIVLSFGTHGTIDRTDMDGDGINDSPGYSQDPCFRHPDTPQPQWPQPVGVTGHEATGQATTSATAALLDDLWHTAVNGYGDYVVMDDTSALTEKYFASAFQAPSQTTAAACAIQQDPSTFETTLYRASYDPTDWHGDVTAWVYDDHSSNPLGEQLWQASDHYQSPGLNADARCVVTFGGPSEQPQGIPFRFDRLSQSQQQVLGAVFDGNQDASQLSQDLVAYIRGEEIPHFRTRSSQLGDVVHSGPVVVENTLFVGANNGMLHALDAQSGRERFAYVPNLVIDGLKALSDPGYIGWHQFYVDGPLWAGEVTVGVHQRNTYLIGGLGKGGRGYYCLRVGRRHRPHQSDGYGDYEWTFHVDELESTSDEETASQVVVWEYPPPDPASDDMDNNGDGEVDEMGESDPHMGYTFGQAYAVNANTAAETYRPVVIFGNGYQSTSQSAVLYILSAGNGELIRKIDTGADTDNGLSTPALVDIDRDQRVDYAYAGDMSGNLWKFDLRSDDPDHWGVAYGEDRNGDGVIDAGQGDQPRPLFQARGQPITGRPDVMAMANACNPEVTGYMVIFGTGRYLATSDPSDHTQQSIYGLWDYGDDSDNSEYLGHMMSRTTGRLSTGFHLVRQTVTGQDNREQTVRQISQATANYAIEADRSDDDQNSDPTDYVGWFLDFPTGSDTLASPGERVIGRVTLRGGKAVLISMVPEQTFCESGGSSWIYILNACDGSPGMVAGEEVYGAIHIEKPIFAEPIILKDQDSPHLDQILVPDVSGRIVKIGFKGEPRGRVYWWQNIE